MCTIMLRQCLKKKFCSHESVFELTRGLTDSQTSINNIELGLLLKKKAEKICKDKIWLSFLCVLALSSVICRPIHLFCASCGFQKSQKMFVKKFIQGKDLKVTNVLSCYGHASIKNKSSFTE